MRGEFFVLLSALVLISGQPNEEENDPDSLEDYKDTSTSAKCPCEGIYSCYCVIPSQCLENKTINYKGAGNVITFRAGSPSDEDEPQPCSDKEVCCMDILGPPRKTTTTSTTTTRIAPTLTPAVRKQCGNKGLSISGSSDETRQGEFPWMLAIFSRDRNNWQFQCGASLISRKVALTVAHCVKEFENKAWALLVRAGAWDLSSDNPDEDKFEEYGVDKVVIHEGFIERKLHNDIAVLILERGVRNIFRNLGLVCLPPNEKQFPYNSSCIATGWGHRRYGSIYGALPSLKQMQLPLLPREICQERLREVTKRKNFRLHETFICAGGVGKQDMCTADGGGPLVCETNGYYVQVGIVSWGVKCHQEGIPGVYVDVAKYRNWIIDKMSISKLG